MAFTSQISAAARADKAGPPATEINDEATLAMPRGRRDLELEERRYATACVRRFAGAAVEEMLEALGLAAPSEPEPEPKPQPSSRIKQCSRCKKTKPVDQFDRNRARADRRATECKACRTELYEQKRDRARVIPDAQRCNRCQLTKPADQFSRDKSRKCGLTGWCKACRNAVKRERLAALKEEAATVTDLNDIAPWPASEDEVTADSLARAIAVRAYALREWAKANVADSHMHALALSAAASALGVVDGLTDPKQADGQRVNARARWMWRTWQDDETADELYHVLSDRFGISPEHVSRLASEDPAA